MRPLKLQIKNIGPYVDETIEFQDIPGDVTAIVGQNGAGKTMLIDSVFAALYREFPSRDSIYKYVTGRAQIVLDFAVGEKCYRSVINIDPKKREMEPWIFSLLHDGSEAALNDGKNGTFDAEIEKLVGPARLALVSVYASQNRNGSFSSLTKAKRKELFINMLGLESLQVVSEKASYKEDDSAKEYEALSNKIEMLKKVGALKHDNIDEMRNKLENMKAEQMTLDAEVQLDTLDLGVLKGKSESVQALNEKESSLSKKEIALKKEMKNLSTEINTAEGLSKRLPELQELVGMLSPAELDLATLQKDQEVYNTQIAAYHSRLSQSLRETKDLQAKAQSARNEAKRAKEQLERAGSDAKIVETVPCQGVGEYASCQFIVNAIAARDSISELEAKIDTETAAALSLESQIKSIPKPEASELKQLTDQLENVKARISSLGDTLKQLDQTRRDIIRVEEGGKRLDQMKARQKVANEEWVNVIAELQLIEERGREARAIQDNANALEIELNKKRKKLDALSNDITVLSDNLNKAVAEQSMADGAWKEIIELSPKLALIDQRRKCWALLSKAFSKTGIQSLEIDAAGPAISEIANDLLFSCFGPRFSIRFVTQVLKDDKKGYKDDFDVYVTDNQKGREGSIDDLSGGEKVIVGEGISLAISLYNRSLVNTGWSTIFRDEASSAVDDKRAPLYIQMLRRAREQGHFEKLYFVSHQERVTAGADAKVIVTSGHIIFE